MNKLSEHFERDEFACECGCGFDTVDIALLNVLEVVRRHFGQPVHITSGCRCEEHNAMIGGSYGSKHKRGIAADIWVQSVKPSEVYEFLDGYMPNSYGIGYYDNFTHIDVRKNKARWRGK